MQLRLSLLQEQYLKEFISRDILGKNDTELLGNQLLEQMEFHRQQRKANKAVFEQKLKDVNLMG